MIRHRKKNQNKTSRSPFAHLWYDLANMPSLNHWPDRPKPFQPDHSEVLIWMADQFGCDLHVAGKMFEAARNKQVITFDHNTKLWTGTKGGSR